MNDTVELYAKQGMGQKIGFGNKPALLIVDMQNDFCDADAPSTLHPSILSTVGPIKQLAEAARAKKVPVIYTQGLVAADGSSAGLWRYKMKHHGLGNVQIEGSRQRLFVFHERVVQITEALRIIEIRDTDAAPPDLILVTRSDEIGRAHV